MYGFVKHADLYPYRNKAIMSIYFFGLHFTFRIGIQNKTWFYVQWVELNHLINKIKNKDPF
jgi:hypothetical protein